MRPCPDHDRLGCPMTRVNRVDGEGPIPCSIMLIGEAPGKNEDKHGKPFIGKSGSELTHLYLGKCANIDRKRIYITNLVKCRTNEKDRDPTQAEIDVCSQLLLAELSEHQPRFIGTIGRLSTQWMFGDSSIRMEKVHGFGYDIGVGGFIMPLYHPAYGLHNTSMIRHIMEDWTRFGKMVRGDEDIMWRAKREVSRWG